MTNKVALSKSELEFINEREQIMSSILSSITDAGKFKVGDYLIAYNVYRGYGGTKKEQITNSYGAPKKYTVVAANSYGIPYIKELNKKGEPVGRLFCPFEIDHRGALHKSDEMEFQVDPDYTDAIILADEENYDASEQHRNKADTFKEITEHNKSLKVNCHDEVLLLQFLQSLKVGDVVYKSIKTYFTILKIDPIPTTHSGNRIYPNTDFGEAQDSKGRIFNLNLRTFKWCAIYRGRPRSYNELKDPK